MSDEKPKKCRECRERYTHTVDCPLAYVGSTGRWLAERRLLEYAREWRTGLPHEQETDALALARAVMRYQRAIDPRVVRDEHRGKVRKETGDA